MNERDFHYESNNQSHLAHWMVASTHFENIFCRWRNFLPIFSGIFRIFFDAPWEHYVTVSEFWEINVAEFRPQNTKSIQSIDTTVKHTL